ncbi:MAG: sulfite exporter TauE/SafE family protein [Planctomycetes bacterium]|nr:sulfite exporter TauE/SafE family protein [Planctomycetota bacterium]
MEAGSPLLLGAIGALSFVLAFIGAGVGLVLGHLRLPLLVAYFGVPGTGTMTNLIISGTGAIAGAASHVRAGRVSWKAVALMGIPSALGAILGVLFFVRLNPLWSYLVIGVMLVVSGFSLIRKKSDAEPGEDISPMRRMALETAIGLALGALAAVTGLMLGSLRLPMMIRYLRMDPKEAIGTNMVVGCVTAAVGSTTGLFAGDGQMPWLVMAVVVPPTILGGWLGGWLTGKITKETVQGMAGVIVMLTGVLLVGQGTVGVVRRPHDAVPPLVHESDFDDWFDFDDDLPEADLEPEPMRPVDAQPLDFFDDAPIPTPADPGEPRLFGTVNL